MYFHAAFGLAKRSPRKKREAEFDGSGVQAEQLGFERAIPLALSFTKGHMHRKGGRHATESATL
jgi:hypothetical protein